MTELDLFPRPSVRIARVSSEDAKSESDVTKHLAEQVRQHEDFYPGIERWFSKKVRPGLIHGERLGFVGYHGEEPVLAGVLKRGNKAKFCHLSIREGFQGSSLGHLMFSLMAAEVRGIAREIHFTLPESLWHREATFFSHFGFVDAIPTHSQYRMFEEELRCSAPWSEVWSNVVQGLPRLLTRESVAGFGLRDGIVISVARNHAQAIMEGRKTIEIRKQFSHRWEGKQAAVYVTGIGALLGVIGIERVSSGSPMEIWERFGPRIGCSKEKFDDYVAECSRVYALHLHGWEAYEAPVPLTQLAHLIGERLTAPQSYAAFSPENHWGRALAVAALLHRRRSNRSPDASLLTL